MGLPRKRRKTTSDNVHNTDVTENSSINAISRPLIQGKFQVVVILNCNWWELTRCQSVIPDTIQTNSNQI